ncbi:MAG: HTH domain-containing protein [Patescibacteria group bacterium]|jgi:transcriptional regulator of heat shock response|nr:HTH domain-containing protein [Patescibacteria group bacterium]
MLDERQGKILKAIVKEYTENANPVSSGYLRKEYNLDYSTATIRSEMAELEEKGFLIKVYVSSGRIPSDKGYRYFIDNLMGERVLSRSYQKKLELELLKQKAKNARLERTTTKLLSSMSECLVLSGIIEKEEYFDFGMHNLLDDPELSDMDDLSRLTSALDLIDENIDKILSQVKEGETKIFVGKENPLKEAQNCSMIVAPYKMKKGGQGLIAIIGPKRMKYGRNKGLIDFVKKMLGGGVAVLVISAGTLGLIVYV